MNNAEKPKLISFEVHSDGLALPSDLEWKVVFTQKNRSEAHPGNNRISREDVERESNLENYKQSSKKPNWSNIHDLLTKGLTKGQLKKFCQVTEAFQPILDQLLEDFTLEGITDKMWEVLRKNGDRAINEFLKWAKEASPDRFKDFGPYYNSEPTLPYGETQK